MNANNNNAQQSAQQPGQNNNQPKSKLWEHFRRPSFTKQEDESTSKFTMFEKMLKDCIKNSTPTLEIDIVRVDHINSDQLTTLIIRAVPRSNTDRKVGGMFFINLPANVPQEVFAKMLPKPLISRHVFETVHQGFSAKLLDKAREGIDIEMVFAGEIYIPWHVEYTDPQVARNIFYKALMEITDAVDNKEKFHPPINLAEVADSSIFKVVIDFKNEQKIQDLYGNFKRADVKVDVFIRSRENRSNGLIETGNVDVGKVYGYFDLTWDEQDDGVKYVPRFIITHLESYSANAETSLFLIAVLNYFNTNMYWTNGFAHLSARGVTRLDDLLENHPELKNDFPSITDSNFVRFLSKVCRSEAVIAIDVDSALDSTAGLSGLSFAKSGDNKAITDLYQRLTNLTDGRIDKFIRDMRSDLPFSHTREAIPVSYFLKGSGDVMMDTRNLDYLIACRVMKTDLDNYINVVTPLGETPSNGHGMFMNNSGDYSFNSKFGTGMYKNIQNRIDIHERVFNSTPEIIAEGWSYFLLDIAERISFRSDFMKGLERAVMECGMRIDYVLKNNKPAKLRANSGLV